MNDAHNRYAEPSMKHLYQARAILRKLRRNELMRLAQNSNDGNEDDRLHEHFSDRVFKLSGALRVLDSFNLDAWAKHTMSSDDKRHLREYEIEFRHNPTATELEPT